MRAGGAVLLLGMAGCGYLSQRGEDFLDAWQAEAHVSCLPGAWIQAGPLAHAGLGWSEGWLSARAGFRYNYPDVDGGRFSSSGPNVHGGPAIESYYLLHGSEGPASQHACFVLLPPLLSREGVHRNWLHAFDVEAAAVPFAGASLGFSPGEFLDFLLGWSTIDLGGDDDASGRAKREYFADQAGKPR